MTGHSTCKEKLLQVIQDSGVLSWSKERWQIVAGQYRVEHFVMYLLKCCISYYHTPITRPQTIYSNLLLYSTKSGAQKATSVHGLVVVEFSSSLLLNPPFWRNVGERD